MKLSKTQISLGVGLLLLFLLRKPAQSAPNAPPDGAPADVDYRGNDNLPRGIRNNNPGNLKAFNIGWQGEVGSDGTFSIFSQYKYGIRAMLKDLTNDYVNKGKHTLRELIIEFAPNSENHTSNYISYVSNRTGINANVPFQNNYGHWKKIIQAMARFENGREAVTTAQFDQVWVEFNF
ncbi:MAG: hypothetical protein AAFZ15_17355 [Bacteroidota bacterium]